MLPDFRVRQRDYLLEIARTLTQELDLDKVLSRILNVSIEMLAGSGGLIAMRGESTWGVLVSQGIPPAFLRSLESLLGNVPYYDNPAENELPEINRVLTEITHAASMGVLNGVSLPMIARKTVVGIIFIFRAYSTSFSSNDFAVLSSFANQAAIAVQNAQFYTQISQEKERLTALLDSLADGVIIFSAQNKVERCNPAFARLVGASPEEIQGKASDQVIQWSRLPQGLTLEQAEAGGWPLTPHAHLHVEGDLLRFDKLPAVPIGITYAPLLSSDGKLLNIIATVRDTTRYRQADELKSTFISIVSHELKTPVALIKGYVSTLRREDARWDPAIVQDSLAVIEDEADHLAELIENLLDASRLQAGGLAIKRSDVNLPELTRRLAARFQTQTTQHKIVVDFPADFPIILADENRIQQVLNNLISNAMKYASSGEIRIQGQTRPQFIIICTSDQGPGIAPDDIPFIFDRFYRAPDFARKTKGAGLGLFLARSIIEAHGGRIWVDPIPGKGARICFSLPYS